jgi:hypothetical protein
MTTTIAIPTPELQAFLQVLMFEFNNQSGKTIDPATLAATYIQPRDGYSLGLEIVSTVTNDNFKMRVYAKFTQTRIDQIDQFELEDVENTSGGVANVRHVCTAEMAASHYPTLKQVVWVNGLTGP